MSAASQDPAVPGGFAPSPKDALEFLQRMWNPLGVPMPGFGLISTDDITGDKVNATIPEIVTAPASVNANSLNSVPVSPP